uniref:Reverse transcriptase zinc-binding domain-containing protein n=1 Tax=Aegilops tauschii subsp. strangulata TaxID=200361 RepID=A0A453JHP1_AEGTS
MVKWADICLPKDRGGLGIPASRRMNVALMLRWVWRILRGDGGCGCSWLSPSTCRANPSWLAHTRLG